MLDRLLVELLLYTASGANNMNVITWFPVCVDKIVEEDFLLLIILFLMFLRLSPFKLPMYNT